MLDMDRAREVFEESEDFTIGIEEEFQILDPQSLDLVQRRRRGVDGELQSGHRQHLTQHGDGGLALSALHGGNRPGRDPAAHRQVALAQGHPTPDRSQLLRRLHLARVPLPA